MRLVTVVLLALACTGCRTKLDLFGDDGEGDADEDGWDADEDCDDHDEDVNPGAVELCNGVDDDCDGGTDEGLAVAVWPDADGDGWGDGQPSEACSSAGWATADGDCDDADPTVHPQAEDACDDTIDSDCDPRDLQCSFADEYGTRSAGAKAYATAANEMAGEYLAVGDIDGDGYDDVALTRFYADGYQGGAAVVYGPVVGEVSLADAGDLLTSAWQTTSAGRTIGVGDVDGDGIDDVALGAPDDTCRAWVTFGPLGGDRALADAQVQRTGRADTEVGHGIAVADVSGDGVGDLIIGAYEADDGPRDGGTVYVEYGPVAEGVASVDEAADARLIGESRGAYAGRYVQGGADVDGDGVGDILVAAPYASDGAPQSGVAYLVHGGVTGDLDLGDADARYAGEAYGDYAGEALALGDVTGDGLGDVLLGSFNSGSGPYAGTAYVVAGPGTHVTGLGDADLVLRGTVSSQQFGLALSGDDLDGDGTGELLVGARGDATGANGGGAAYLYWGPVAGAAGPDDADVVFVGEDRGAAVGYSVGLGDLDGDGAADVLLGAPSDGTGGVAAGALFVFYTGD